jgi:hypothetical protein
MQTRFFCCLAAIAVFGCSSESSKREQAQGGAGGQAGEGSAGETEAGAGSASIPDFTLRGPCVPGERVGGFSLMADEDNEYAWFEGMVRDGIDPIDVPEPIDEDGECRLVRRPHLACATACESEFTCNAEGKCQSMARAKDCGTVTLLGLDEALTAKPSDTNKSYFEDVANPPLAAGSKTALSTTDGYAGVLSLYGYGVTPLELLTGRLALGVGKDLLVRWTPSDTEASARVTLSLSVDQHGSTPARLLCDFEDSGEVTVPAALMDQLLDAGVTGFPLAVVERRTTDSVSVPDGCAEFVVGSRRSPSVAIAGYTPCTSTANCPENQVCNTALERCE